MIPKTIIVSWKAAACKPVSLHFVCLGFKAQASCFIRPTFAAVRSRDQAGSMQRCIKCDQVALLRRLLGGVFSFPPSWRGRESSRTVCSGIEVPALTTPGPVQRWGHSAS